ncbi:tripartite tricarboxylate transporter substrate binding protein [Aquincola tertiaricarbonis]|uniref:Tripartite tricarboxylate transporter substrate binding protein n=1 Tax=Aquincola tertiaricarbonis TaxID=391953 RepID=A0ABY4SGH7_AQUTE|nr:tripartite tricarboxylate transporter substrate binding protein [Aquincola tertiaricarbonis]URI10992.1 tripartite tricarboxylate transporter substrate binding protein [Aquincola tertiaricarbonis]
MQRRHLMRLLAAAASAATLPAAVNAQPGAADYPKPGATLRYVVPFPPGGLTDMMARSVGQQLAERWKVSVVVDNKPGGGGQIGADAVAKAPADGHTLLAITLTHAANVTLFPKAAFDFRKDLKPVALLAGSPMLVVVPANSPIKDLKDLAAQAKQRALNAGSSGNGTPPHLTLALFNDLNKTSIQHVPYKGGAPSMTDLIGGQLDVIFSNFPESIAHVKAGKLRALAVSTEARHPAVPDVPTTAEAGLPGLLVENWTAVMVPAGVPDALVQKLGNEVVAIVKQPDMEQRAVQQGFRVDARGPEAFKTFLDGEVTRWAGVIQKAGIRPD